MDHYAAAYPAAQGSRRMSPARISYRVRQFWKALFARPDWQDLALARVVLGPQSMELFLRMQPGEQLHSLQVYHQIAASLEEAPVEESEHLLVAALLHDVGKSRYPLSLWERVIIVLGKAIAPGLVNSWGGLDELPLEKISLWRRPFVVAAQHARWGAEMAARAGISPLAVTLILRHQDTIHEAPATVADRLLKVLQSIDDQM